MANLEWFEGLPNSMSRAARHLYCACNGSFLMEGWVFLLTDVEVRKISRWMLLYMKS